MKKNFIRIKYKFTINTNFFNPPNLLNLIYSDKNIFFRYKCI